MADVVDFGSSEALRMSTVSATRAIAITSSTTWHWGRPSGSTNVAAQYPSMTGPPTQHATTSLSRVSSVPRRNDAAGAPADRAWCASGALTLTDPALASAQLYHAMLGGLLMRLLTNASAPTAREIEAGITNAVEIFLASALR